MKILVGVKRVVDHHVNIVFKSDGSGIETDNLSMAINPFDEVAVEEAIRIKESGLAKEIVLLSIGNEKCEDTLRSALSMGADRAILIKYDDSSAQLEPLAISKLFKYIAEKEEINLILMGKQSIDDDNNQVGQMTSALLNWSQATFASAVVFEENAENKPTFALVARGTDFGLEKIKITLPSVITVDLHMNTPRFSSLPNIIKAKKKQIELLQLFDLERQLNLSLHNHLEIVSIKPPPKRKKGIQLKSVDELISVLKQLHVIK